MVLAERGRRLVQEITAGIGDLHVNFLNVGFGFFPVAAELLFVRHAPLVFGECGLLALEAVTRFHPCAIGERRKTRYPSPCLKAGVSRARLMIGMIFIVAFHAHKPRLRLTIVRRYMVTFGAFLTGVMRWHSEQHAAFPCQLVVELPSKFTPALVENGFV